jgi:hypothetical protein
MRWILALALLVPAVAKADSIDNFSFDGQWFTATWQLPPTVAIPTVCCGGAWEFDANISYLGGVLVGDLLFYSPPDPTMAEIGFIDALPVSLPPGFVWDPNKSFYEQWPYDLQHTTPWFCCSDGSALFTRSGNTLTWILGNHGNLTITDPPVGTPEPSSILLLTCALLAGISIKQLDTVAKMAHSRR